MENSVILDIENISQNGMNNNNLSANLNIKTKNSSHDDDIIEIKDVSHSSIYTTICKRDKLLAEFIDKCLELEYEGMAKVVHTLLLPYYNKADEAYTQSCSFKKVIKKAINRIETDPGHKFSHIRDLCETLELHKSKKRENLTNDIAKNTSFIDTGIKRKNTQRVSSNIKKQKVNVIEIDDEQDLGTLRPSPVINLDECDTDVEIITKTTVQVVEDKENNARENENITESPDKLLVLQNVGNFNEPNVIDDTEKIKRLEAQIAAYKEQIVKLDEQEVCDDTLRSPYIMSEKLKAKVVALYKKICAMKGAEIIKRREIRLKVIDGHPPGPVKILEKFLNDHIGSNGDPPFPDFIDVVHCVEKANITDSLHWNQNQIMQEAYALFTQCGKALQAKRQRREWRDLLDRVKIEACDYDPADESPELAERLNRNKQLAVKNESHIFERYTRLQYSDREIFLEPSAKTNNAQADVQTKRFIVDNRNDKTDSLDVNEDSDVKERTNFQNNGIPKSKLTEHGNKILNYQTSNSNLVEVSEIELCSDKPICDIEKGNESTKSTSTIIGMKEKLTISIDVVQSDFNRSIPEISVNAKCDDMSQVNIKPEPTRNDETDSSDVKERTNFENNGIPESKQTEHGNEILDYQISNSIWVDIPKIEKCDKPICEIEKGNESIKSTSTIIRIKDKLTNSSDVVKSDFNSSIPETSVNAKCDDMSQVNIKPDPDAKLLEIMDSFGNDYTTTVVEILNPFLIIEISSDSDTDESAED